MLGGDGVLAGAQEDVEVGDRERGGLGGELEDDLVLDDALDEDPAELPEVVERRTRGLHERVMVSLGAQRSADFVAGA